MSQSIAAVPAILDTPSAWAQVQAEFARQGVIAEEPSLERLAERALQALIATLGAHRASLSVIDPVSGVLTIAAAVGSPETRIGLAITRPRSASEWVLREGRGLVMQGQVRSGEIEGTADSRIQSSLVIPLCGERGTLGVLSLGRGGGLPAFVEGDLPLAMSTLIPLSLAIGRRLESARAHRALVEVDGASLAPGAPWRGRPLCAPDYECAAARHASREHGWSFATHAITRNGSPVLMAADGFERGLSGLERARLLEGTFEAIAAESDDLASLAVRLDRAWRARPGDSRLPVWIAQLRPAGAVQTCSFGSRAFYLVPSGDDDIRVAAPADPALGMEREGDPHVQTHRLLPGDTLIVVGESVLEVAAEADRPFGHERVRETLAQARARPLDQLPRAVCDQALAHGGRPWWRSDLLAVALRYRREDF